MERRGVDGRPPKVQVAERQELKERVRTQARAAQEELEKKANVIERKGERTIIEGFEIYEEPAIAAEAQAAFCRESPNAKVGGLLDVAARGQAFIVEKFVGYGAPKFKKDADRTVIRYAAIVTSISNNETIFITIDELRTGERGQDPASASARQVAA